MRLILIYLARILPHHFPDGPHFQGVRCPVLELSPISPSHFVHLSVCDQDIAASLLCIAIRHPRLLSSLCTYLVSASRCQYTACPLLKLSSRDVFAFCFLSYLLALRLLAELCQKSTNLLFLDLYACCPPLL